MVKTFFVQLSVCEDFFCRHRQRVCPFKMNCSHFAIFATQQHRNSNSNSDKTQDHGVSVATIRSWHSQIHFALHDASPVSQRIRACECVRVSLRGKYTFVTIRHLLSIARMPYSLAEDGVCAVTSHNNDNNNSKMELSRSLRVADMLESQQLSVMYYPLALLLGRANGRARARESLCVCFHIAFAFHIFSAITVSIFRTYFMQ